ncbi:MAG: ABC transporter permease subunit [Anaerolineae bacterium]|nr:ABC transporter permease subunit [Anaerolineae bacterium]
MSNNLIHEPDVTFTIARLTFREAARRKILLAALLLGVLFLGVYGAGLYFTNQDVMRSPQANKPVVTAQIYNFLALSGLYVVNFLFVMITVLTSVDTIAGEIVSGTIHALAAKPLRRWEILIGKWIGYVVMLTLYFLLMAGGVTLVVRAVTGYDIPNIGWGLVFIWLNGLLLLNVTLLGSTQFSALANGVFVFTMFGVAFLGGWIEQIGSFLSSQTAVNVGIVSSLLMPSEALWKRAAYEMRSLAVDAVGFSPFTSASSVPSALMLGYAVLYAALALGFAIWNFERRDL